MKVQMGKHRQKHQKLTVIVTYSKAFSRCFPFWVNFIFEMAKQKCIFSGFLHSCQISKKRFKKKGQILD
jgi:hypothetical protein